MKGIRNRVATGFTCLIVLLIASGMISLFELNTMSNDTKSIIEASRNSMEIARDMIKCIDDHRVAVMHASVFGEDDYSASCDSLVSMIEGKIRNVSSIFPTAPLDSIEIRLRELDSVTEEFFRSDARMEYDMKVGTLEESFKVDSLVMSGEIWFSSVYTPAYKSLVRQITYYITESFDSLTPRAEQLKKNAYRSVAPVFIAILVMIAITLIFHYLIHIYCIKPIVRIQQGLNNYLTYGMPYSAKAEKIDEIEELDNEISTLVGSSRLERTK